LTKFFNSAAVALIGIYSVGVGAKVVGCMKISLNEPLSIPLTST
jgi:hypothetical protein